MTAQDRCELTELLIEQCGCRLHAGAAGATARGLTAEVEPYARRNGDQPSYGAPIIARYGGRCPECQERYEPGDTIRPQRFKTTGNHTGTWVHTECAEEN